MNTSPLCLSEHLIIIFFGSLLVGTLFLFFGLMCTMSSCLFFEPTWVKVFLQNWHGAFLLACSSSSWRMRCGGSSSLCISRMCLFKQVIAAQVEPHISQATSYVPRLCSPVPFCIRLGQMCCPFWRLVSCITGQIIPGFSTRYSESFFED